MKRKRFVSVVLFFALVLSIAGSALAYDSGFAKVRANGTLATFGGDDTTAATAVRFGPGYYTATFFGNFPSQTQPDKVVINTTVESFDYGVSNAWVVNADPGQITVVVFTWKSNNVLNTVDNAFFVSIFVGN